MTGLAFIVASAISPPIISNELEVTSQMMFSRIATYNPETLKIESAAVLLDTGANCNYMSSILARKLNLKLKCDKTFSITCFKNCIEMKGNETNIGLLDING